MENAGRLGHAAELSVAPADGLPHVPVRSTVGVPGFWTLIRISKGMLKNRALSAGVSLTTMSLLPVADGRFRGEARGLTGSAINLLRRKAAHEAAR